MLKHALLASVFASCALGTMSAPAALLQHRDIHELVVPGSFGIAGGTWGVESNLNFLDIPEPHVVAVKDVLQFQSINIYTANASLFTPLFVPGDLLGPGGVVVPAAGANLADQGVYHVDWTLTGPARFFYDNTWTVRVEDNRKLPVVEYTFTANAGATLTVGPGQVTSGIGGTVTYKPAMAGPTLFETIPLPNLFDLLLTPTEAEGGQGFFASGGRIVVTGWVQDLGEGISRLLYDNPHYATGEGILVQDFTRALGTGVVRTEVFDEHTSIPEPSTLLLLLIGMLASGARPAKKLRRLNRSFWLP